MLWELVDFNFLNAQDTSLPKDTVEAEQPQLSGTISDGRVYLLGSIFLLKIKDFAMTLAWLEKLSAW